MRNFSAAKVFFTTKIDGQIHTTSDLAQVKKWREQKRFVLFGRGVWRFNLDNGKSKKEINPNKHTVDDFLRLVARGWTLEKTKEKEEIKVVSKLNEVLTTVADELEPTNAKKAHYFRNATPYQDGRLLVVDFPTSAKLIKNTAEEFRLAGKPHQIKTLYHGTRLHNIPSIMKRGLKRSNHGMLGEGIYVGPIHKAENYTDLVILEVKVVLGHCKELEKVETLHENPDFDSLHAKSGPMPGVYKRFLNNEEWVVRFPKQVEVARLVVSPVSLLPY